jgi:1-acyl-sn-glycerol-3-phosphate acyltransferase
MEGDRFVLRSITDEIMYELSKLSGQEYVDVYASSVKKPGKPAKKSRARKAAERRATASATA